MTQQPWMDEFEKRWYLWDYKHDCYTTVGEDVKQFITTQIAAAEERGRDAVVDYVFEHLEFDGTMHRKGQCSFPMIAICSAEEHKVKNLLYEARPNRPTV